MPTDLELLEEFKNLVPKRSRPVTLTPLSLIVPIGDAGYALDNNNRVIGLKCGGRLSKKLINKVTQFLALKRLVLYSDYAIDFPADIKNLTELQFLWLGGHFKRIPKEILSLNLPLLGPSAQAGYESLEPHLSRFAMDRLRRSREPSFEKPSESTQVSVGLPPEVEAEILNLSGVLLAVEEVADPPLEILAQGREAIELYFRDRAADSLRLNELKVLLVGNGAAGKTSLVKRFLGDAFDADEAQTHGINIRPWSVKTNKGTDVKLHFWDFGGQEIMHATHQFFLSKRSLYILVLDGRKEEDPEYWLQHIESFGGDSPIIIVLNKIDEHPAFDVNRRFLKSKYKGIVDFFRISCATGFGVQDVIHRLAVELDNVSMLETFWPRPWFRVKLRLETHGAAYVSLNQYRDICREEGVNDEKSQDTLVEFLNDLGVVLHFKEMELLDTHVLDPRWVTEAVYRIINSELLASQKGFLKLAQLPEALKPTRPEALEYPVDKHRYIIDLMLKFELCYELDGNALLMPDLLDIQEPATSFDHKDALRFVLEYSYLPKGIMPRFIVRMNKDIKETMRWRTGVLLEERSFGATALVLADEKEKRIYIFVIGTQKRDYFSVIRKVLNDINSSFEKLGVTELVPLPDNPDVVLDYRELLGYELAERQEIFVGRLGKSYDVQMLLNGLEKSVLRRSQPSQLIVVEGNYFADSRINADRFATVETQTKNGNNVMDYTPSTWEKILVYVTGFLFLAVVSFLVVRNQPIADKNLVVLVRTVLSVFVAIFGATIPGMLKVDLSTKGLSIRAIGALALFVITFLLTPKVL